MEKRRGVEHAGQGRILWYVGEESSFSDLLSFSDAADALRDLNTDGSSEVWWDAAKGTSSPPSKSDIKWKMSWSDAVGAFWIMEDVAPEETSSC